MPTYQLEGWDELKDNLKKLGPRTEKNILRGMVRAEANYFAARMKEKAPMLQPGTDNPHERYPGQMRDAIHAVSLNPSSTPGSVVAGVAIRGSREALEAARGAGRALRRGAKGIKTAAAGIAAALADGFYWRWVEFGSPHNRPAQPFARPTWDEQKSGSLTRMADYAGDRVEKMVHD